MGGIAQLKIMLILSDVPTTVPEQVEYFNNLKQAIRSILTIDMDWKVNISVADASLERVLGMTSNIVVSVTFLCLSAGPGDISTLQSKLDSPKFLDQLNFMGFKASKAGLQSTDTSNQAPSPLVVGLCSAEGGLTCLVMLLFLARHFFSCPQGKFEIQHLWIFPLHSPKNAVPKTKA